MFPALLKLPVLPFQRGNRLLICAVHRLLRCKPAVPMSAMRFVDSECDLGFQLPVCVVRQGAGWLPAQLCAGCSGSTATAVSEQTSTDMLMEPLMLMEALSWVAIHCRASVGRQGGGRPPAQHALAASPFCPTK